MQVEVPPPQMLRWFLIGLPLLVLAVSLALRRRPLLHRVVPPLFVALVCAFVAARALRPLRFAWDDAGIRDGTFGAERAIPWSDVREARLVRAFRDTPLRPVRRTHGTYYSGYASGTWTLADGRSVRVFLEPGSCDALLLTTPGGTCLYAPLSFERFLETARSHVRLADAR